MEENRRPPPVEELVKVDLYGLGNFVRIEVALQKEYAYQLTKLLIKLKELFPFNPSNMSRIATNDITHELNIDSLLKLVAQRKRMMGDETRLAIIA